MKTLLVNLDILFFKNYDDALASLLQEINLLHTDQTAMIGYIVMEIIPPQEFEQFHHTLVTIKDYVYQKDIHSFSLILMNSYRQYEKRLTDFNVVYFDFLANLTANGYKKSPDRVNNLWNKKTDRYLLLTGIPHRYNRVRLLHKIYKENLLNDKSGIWSFFQPFSVESLDSCRTHLSGLSHVEFDNFLTHAVRKVDNVQVIGGKFAAQTRGEDYTLEKNLYQDTTISIISETFFYNHHPNCDLSEKTWRPIINRHPFLIAGTVGICSFLKSLGFKTFVEYMPVNYDIIENDNDRLDAIVYNLTEFERTKLKYAQDIDNDINHNYHKVFEMLDHDKKTLMNLLTKHQISQNEINLLLNSKNYWHLITPDLITTLDQKQNPQIKSTK